MLGSAVHIHSLYIYQTVERKHSLKNSTSFFKFIFISWRLITFQYCSGFCHTLTWISHGSTFFPILIPPPITLSTRFLWVFPVHQARALVSCIGLGCNMSGSSLHMEGSGGWRGREWEQGRAFWESETACARVLGQVDMEHAGQDVTEMVGEGLRGHRSVKM